MFREAQPFHFRLLVALFVVASASGLATGCTAIADLGSYRSDRGCDMRASFRGFGPHANTNQAFYLRVEMTSTTSEFSLLTGSFVVQPLPGSDFDLHVPGGIFTAFAHVDYFIDVDGDRNYTPLDGLGVRLDEGWVYERACTRPAHAIAYNENFFDFDAPTPIGRDLEISLEGFPVFKGPVEVRAFVDDPLIGERTLCFFRGPSTNDGTVDVVVPGCVPPNTTLHLEVWVDENDDNNVDPWPAESAFGFDVDTSSLPPGALVVSPPMTAVERPHSGTVVLTLLN